ncbi:hypothetical protein KJA15_03075 [Patescibacteria group bacterium]|nr:hypothetical protein [Patescibacteria group bacterium]
MSFPLIEKFSIKDILAIIGGLTVIFGFFDLLLKVDRRISPQRYKSKKKKI